MKVIYNRNNVRMIGPAVLVPGALTEIPDEVWPAYENHFEIVELIKSGDLVIAEAPKAPKAPKAKAAKGNKAAETVEAPEVSDDELSDLLG